MDGDFCAMIAGLVRRVDTAQDALRAAADEIERLRPVGALCSLDEYKEMRDERDHLVRELANREGVIDHIIMKPDKDQLDALAALVEERDRLTEERDRLSADELETIEQHGRVAAIWRRFVGGSSVAENGPKKSSDDS